LQAQVISQGTADASADGTPMVPTTIDSFKLQ
jgi:hypothetical protein